MQKEVFDLFPTYKDREMHKCNYAEQKRSITLDAGLLCEKLLEALEKEENFTLKRNSEVNMIRTTG